MLYWERFGRELKSPLKCTKDEQFFSLPESLVKRLSGTISKAFPIRLIDGVYLYEDIHIAYGQTKESVDLGLFSKDVALCLWYLIGQLRSLTDQIEYEDESENKASLDQARFAIIRSIEDLLIRWRVILVDNCSDRIMTDFENSRYESLASYINAHTIEIT